MSADAVAPGTGKTRLRTTLERAQKGGKPCIGQWMEFPGASLARTVASMGPDWVLLDCEHGNIDDSEMHHCVAAIAATGSSPIVRIMADQHWMIKRALDAGVHGIMVPMCESAEQARKIVNATKYPSKEYPFGNRGTGAMWANMNFGQDAREYYSTSNKNIVVIVQIESLNGLENCEEIAQVPGIDMLFIGPNDLASSLGYFAFDHASIPEVQEAAIRVLKAARSAGKFAGHFALSADIAAQRSRQGFDFVNYGADIVAVCAWMATEKAKLETLLEQSDQTAQVCTCFFDAKL